MSDPARILVVDDIEDNRIVLKDRLESQGYEVELAEDGLAALVKVRRGLPDIILLDVLMPGLDGIETVKALKSVPLTAAIPVILLTSKAEVRDVVAGLEAGADEYLTKPIDHSALIARVRAMLRLKRLQDQLRAQSEILAAQARDLAELNNTLSARVAEQVAEIERVSRLKRFLAPQVAQAILASPSGEAALASHRAFVAVLFCDLRDFTAFAETAEPEDVIGLLSEYHRTVGELVFSHHGTLERFAGDGVMVLFNDPTPCLDPCGAAVQLAAEIRGSMAGVLARWRDRGAALGIGIGLAAGFATVGRVGFDKRFDYAAIGSVTNLAARLCELAEAEEILVSGRVASEVRRSWIMEQREVSLLRGFSRPMDIYEVVRPIEPYQRPNGGPI